MRLYGRASEPVDGERVRARLRSEGPVVSFCGNAQAPRTSMLPYSSYLTESETSLHARSRRRLVLIQLSRPFFDEFGEAVLVDPVLHYSPSPALPAR